MSRGFISRSKDGLSIGASQHVATIPTRSVNSVANKHMALRAFILSLSVIAAAGPSFTDYSDVQHLFPFLPDTLPPRLRASDLPERRKAWSDWVVAHDRDIRSRLLRGDEDTIINWLLFGTSFTRQPRAFFDAPATPDTLPKLISTRTKDLISVLASPDTNERLNFARRLLLSQGYAFDSAVAQTSLEQHLYAEVDRVIAERQQFMRREEAPPAGDLSAQIMAESRLFHDRGLSLDTSLLSSFAVDQALETMQNQRLLRPGGIRRVAVIGPGLDFADKNSGYDFYPVQTLQPFTSIDSLVRLGLAAGPGEIDVTTFDISPRVNDHIQAIRQRAKSGAAYVLRLPIDFGSAWTPSLVSYWKTLGGRIGSETPLQRLAELNKGLEIRAIAVRPQVALRINPIDWNVVTEKWSGPLFDLVIATNVLVYYDTLDQRLAFAAIERMLRPGGFFLTNNAVVELPVSQLRSVGVITVQHSSEKIDHVFWYRRNER